MTTAPSEEIVSMSEKSESLDDLIALVGELHELISAENALLASGMPASISQNIVVKAKLSAELDAWMARIRAGDRIFVEADKEQHRELVAQLTQLQDAMGENMSRLKRAMAVTRWRIEAIMSAVREQTKAENAYDQNGACKRVGTNAYAGGTHMA